MSAGIFLKLNEKLNLRAANNAKVNIEGVFFKKFEMRNQNKTFDVPLLVTGQITNYSFIGYNITEHFILNLKCKNLATFLQKCSVIQSLIKIELMYNIC